MGNLMTPVPTPFFRGRLLFSYWGSFKSPAVSETPALSSVDHSFGTKSRPQKTASWQQHEEMLTELMGLFGLELWNTFFGINILNSSNCCQPKKHEDLTNRPLSKLLELLDTQVFSWSVQRVRPLEISWIIASPSKNKRKSKYQFWQSWLQVMGPEPIVIRVMGPLYYLAENPWVFTGVISPPTWMSQEVSKRLVSGL